jgi:hypothetical protein
LKKERVVFDAAKPVDQPSNRQGKKPQNRWVKKPLREPLMYLLKEPSEPVESI